RTSQLPRSASVAAASQRLRIMPPPFPRVRRSRSTTSLRPQCCLRRWTPLGRSPGVATLPTSAAHLHHFQISSFSSLVSPASSLPCPTLTRRGRSDLSRACKPHCDALDTRHPRQKRNSAATEYANDRRQTVSRQTSLPGAFGPAALPDHPRPHRPDHRQVGLA